MKRARGAVAAATMVAVLSACGSSEESASGPASGMAGGTSGGGAASATPAAPAAAPSDQVLRQAASATVDAGTAAVQLRTQVQSEAAAAATTDTTATGVVDFGSGNQRVVTQRPTGGESEELVVDGVRYLRSGLTARPGDKPWRRSAPSGDGATGPRELLDALASAAPGRLREIGREPVRGDQTVHYRTQIEVDALLAALGSSAGGATGNAPQGDEQAEPEALFGDGPVPMDVWLDEQQRIRRLQYTVTLNLPGAPQPAPGAPSTSGAAPPATAPTPAAPAASGGQLTSTLEFYDFGIPVQLQPPPAEQVQEASGRTPALPTNTAVPPASGS